MNNEEQTRKEYFQLLLKQLSTAEMLIEDDTDVFIKISLPGDNFYEYKVTNNKSILTLINTERGNVIKTLRIIENGM